MKIYVSDAWNNKLRIMEALNYGAGHMVTPSYLRKKQQVFWALDNGAFGCYKKGHSFDIDGYFTALEKSIRFSRKPDFTVLPDIVAGGKNSLNFSMLYVNDVNDVKKYLALQDGMKIEDVKACMSKIDGFFVGGTVSWKFRTMEIWIKLAHKFKKPCHIGRIGTLESYQYCFLKGADSVDGSNPSRNNKMHIINDFNAWRVSHSNATMELQEQQLPPPSAMEEAVLNG